MILSIHQPNFIPWLGFFHKVMLSDIFVLLDNVQFEKNSFINRNKVKIVNGCCWLTVPVKLSRKFGIKINKVEIANKQAWRKKHLATIMHNYKKTPYFEFYKPFFMEMYTKDWSSLVELNVFVLKKLFQMLSISTKIVLASTLEINGKKSDLVLNICKKYNADIYISGNLGRNYLINSDFCAAGIQIYYQNYQHPIYQQLYGDFLPYMSIIDLICNCGPNSKNIILNGNIRKDELQRDRFNHS